MSGISALQSSSLSSLYSAVLASQTGSLANQDTALDSLYSALLAGQPSLSGAEGDETGETGTGDAGETGAALKAAASMAPLQLLNSYMYSYFDARNSGLDLESLLSASLQARLNAASAATSGTSAGGSLDVTA